MPWQPGESGNPNGSKKPKRFLQALERAMASDEGNLLRSAAEKLLKCAADGEPWAIQMLADRLDGKPVQQIAADPDGGTVAIALVAYHPAQLPAETVSTSGPRSIGFREETSGSDLAS